MRAKGYRPVQVWVPDVRTAAFRAEAQRQSALVNTHRNSEDQAFIEAVAASWDE
jgi:hypothetical protein